MVDAEELIAVMPISDDTERHKRCAWEMCRLSVEAQASMTGQSFSSKPIAAT